MIIFLLCSHPGIDDDIRLIQSQSVYKKVLLTWLQMNNGGGCFRRNNRRDHWQLIPSLRLILPHGQLISERFRQYLYKTRSQLQSGGWV